MNAFAAVEVPSSDLACDIALLESEGFRLDVIFPADSPRVAMLSGHGVQLRLDTESTAPAPIIELGELSTSSPVAMSGGALLRLSTDDFSASELADELVVTNGGSFGVGRAGMHYRDLLPNRHGGRVIASHIRIAEAGPVPDNVHHHEVMFQMIYCRRGRVQVVYEDQGEPFWMEAGDCVLQPPHIRHRVLASADSLEVVEISSPAEHPTFIDHDLALPTSTVNLTRNFGGQRFSFDRAADTAWVDAEPGWLERSTGIAAATNGNAVVRTVRAAEAASMNGEHSGDLWMLYVVDGTASIDVDGVGHSLAVDETVAVPQATPWSLTANAGFEALLVQLL